MAKPNSAKTPGPAAPKRRLSDPAEPDALASQAWLSVARCYHLCDAVLTQRLAALGVRLQEHEVLLNLLRSPELTQKELAQRCFVAKSGVSMLVSSMEGRGLLERRADPQDARARRLALSREGAALARKCRQVQDEVIGCMTGGQPAEVLRTVRDSMHDASQVLDGLLQAGAATRAKTAREPA